jgi:hypothetical protein
MTRLAYAIYKTENGVRTLLGEKGTINMARSVFDAHLREAGANPALLVEVVHIKSGQVILTTRYEK